MNPNFRDNAIYERDRSSFRIFQDYLHYCSEEQVTLNNMLHTQNLLSNNRYNMFNQMFRYVNQESSSFTPWPNTPFTTPNIFNQTSNRNRNRPPPRNRNRIVNNLQFEHTNPMSFRPIHFPGNNRTRNRNTPNPLTEFINETLNDNTRRRPTTMRQFFDSCRVFIYSNDLSNNQIHCPITMQNFQEGEICIRMPCNHIFKYRPLLQWLSTARTCPMCRRQIPRTSRHTARQDVSNNSINVHTNNVSIQTSDISNGFIADISANNIRDLSQALSQTVVTRIQNLFSNIDISNSTIPMAWSTNISLVTPRDNRQSPINIIETIDTSGNIGFDHFDSAV